MSSYPETDLIHSFEPLALAWRTQVAREKTRSLPFSRQCLSNLLAHMQAYKALLCSPRAKRHCMYGRTYIALSTANPKWSPRTSRHVVCNLCSCDVYVYQLHNCCQLSHFGRIEVHALSCLSAGDVIDGHVRTYIVRS